MESKNNGEDFMLPLEDDEGKHLKSIPNKYADLLQMANKGALLVQTMSVEGSSDLSVSDPRTILAMLTLKIVEQLHTTIMALQCGHYSSVPVLLRSSFDTIAVLHAIGRDDFFCKLWLLLSYAEHVDLGVDHDRILGLRQQFISKCRQSYGEHLDGDAHSTPIVNLIRDFNSHVHPDVFGCFERAGVLVSPEEMFGKKIRLAIGTAEGDLINAIKLMDLDEKQNPGTKVPDQPFLPLETVTYGPGVMNDDLLRRYSKTTLAAAVHLYETVSGLLLADASSSLRKQGQAWYSRSIELLRIPD